MDLKSGRFKLVFTCILYLVVRLRRKFNFWKFRNTQGKFKKGVNINKFSAVRMTTFCYISISKVDWRSANKLLIIFVTLLIILWKIVKTKFLRVINFEKWLIAEKGRKRPKKSCRPNADLDKLKRPNWSQTTKNGNTEFIHCPQS